MRVVVPGSGTDSTIAVAGSHVSLTGSGVTFVPGRTYTILARQRLAGPLTGPLSVYARRSLVQYNTAPGWAGASALASPPTSNAEGEYEHRVTFTVPPTAVWCLVRLYNGASAGGGDVWWDDLMIVEGVYTGGFRYGDSPGWRWQGTAHQSASSGPGGP